MSQGYTDTDILFSLIEQMKVDEEKPEAKTILLETANIPEALLDIYKALLLHLHDVDISMFRVEIVKIVKIHDQTNNFPQFLHNIEKIIDEIYFKLLDMYTAKQDFEKFGYLLRKDVIKRLYMNILKIKVVLSTIVDYVYIEYEAREEGISINNPSNQILDGIIDRIAFASIMRRVTVDRTVYEAMIDSYTRLTLTFNGLISKYTNNRVYLYDIFYTYFPYTRLSERIEDVINLIDRILQNIKVKDCYGKAHRAFIWENLTYLKRYLNEEREPTHFVTMSCSLCSKPITSFTIIGEP